MDHQSVIEIIILIILIVLSSFFSGVETAFSSISKAKARSMEEENLTGAKTVSKVLENYDRMLTTILIGNNIVNLSASSLATTFTMKVFGNLYISLATGILTLLVLIFGEIVPKTYARHNADNMARHSAWIVNFLMIVLIPLVWAVEKLSGGVLRLMGQKKWGDSLITESELRSYVDVSHEDGAIESDEHTIINNVFDFSDSVARDIMIPRIDIASVPDTAGYRDVLKLFRDTMYTRLPVYHEDKENIIGFINVKDLIRLKNPQNFTIQKFLREGYYTYEYKKTNDLLLEMRAAFKNLAFINDEYGATVGMVTLEDLLEEIVGEIRDEYDQEEVLNIQKEGEGYLIEAGMKLEDVNDAIGTDFESEDYGTIGGLVLDELDRIPEDNEEVTLEDGTRLKVCGMRQNRIAKVLVTLPVKEEKEEE